jgi:hypothetical protein
MEREAFLMARITGWEDLDLLKALRMCTSAERM